MAFAELCITSNFTFLTGASHPEEYARRAVELGLPAFAIADRNSVAGVVRAHVELRETARAGGPVPRLIPAARLVLTDGVEITALPRDRAAWGRLCRVLSRGARRAAKGECELHFDDLDDLGADVGLLLHPPRATTSDRGAGAWASRARDLTRRLGSVHLAAAPRYDGRDAARIGQARPARGGSGRAARRHGRADDASRQPPPAGRRADLHPRGAAHRRDRTRGARQRRAQAAPRGRHAAPVRGPRGRGAPQRRHRRILPLLARRAALRIPLRGAGRRAAAGAAGPSDRRGAALALSRRRARPRPRPGRPRTGADRAG